MKRERITDLDKFVKEHIQMPYSNMIPENEAKRINLNNYYHAISAYPEWWQLVASRIQRIGFYFPHYIKHELVDVINSLQVTDETK